jgi:predicted transcriptional regulator
LEFFNCPYKEIRSLRFKGLGLNRRRQKILFINIWLSREDIYGLKLWDFSLIIIPYSIHYLFKKGDPMSQKLKVTITIDEAVVREIDRFSKVRGRSRSRLIEEAIKDWGQKRLERELIEGYLAMAKEDVVTAESNLEVGREVLK